MPCGICRRSIGFVDPSLLDGFQDTLTAAAVVVIEILEADDIVVQVDKTNGGRIHIRISIIEGFGDRLYIRPFHVRVFLMDMLMMMDYSVPLQRRRAKKFPPSAGLDVMAGEGERLEIKRFDYLVRKCRA